jgi:hypothetical protein
MILKKQKTKITVKKSKDVKQSGGNFTKRDMVKSIIELQECDNDCSLSTPILTKNGNIIT